MFVIFPVPVAFTVSPTLGIAIVMGVAPICTSIGWPLIAHSAPQSIRSTAGNGSHSARTRCLPVTLVMGQFNPRCATLDQEMGLRINGKK